MIDLFELYENLKGRVNLAQGGHVSPERNFIQWVNTIQISLYEEKFSIWEKSQKIIDDMSQPFLKSVNVTVVNGVFQYPEDYGHYSSARYYKIDDQFVPMKDRELYDPCGKQVKRYKSKPKEISQEVWDVIVAEMKGTSEQTFKKAKEIQVDWVPNGKWGDALNSRFAGPTQANPKITQYDKGFKVAPADITVMVLDYLKKPTPAVFAYTVIPGDPETGEGDYIQYDKAKSVQLEWSPLVVNEFLSRLEAKFSKFIQNSQMYEMSTRESKTEI